MNSGTEKGGPINRAQKAVLIAQGKEALRVKVAAVERYDPRTASGVTEWVAELTWRPAHLTPASDGRRVSRRSTFAAGPTPADALVALANLIRVGWSALEAEIEGTGVAGS